LKFLLQAADAEIDIAAELLSNFPAAQALTGARTALHEDLRLAQDDDPQLYGPEIYLDRQQGFVRVAFRLAFWELLHAPTFEAGLIDVVNRGGDADTNGAVAGALLGAAHTFLAIPTRWCKPVMGALQSGPPSPLRYTFHAKRLLELVPA
jgi:ADP-ribosylglycohydrolase